jgi:hypothetical protein
VILNKRKNMIASRVEAGYNTSTVALRVVEGDEKGRAIAQAVIRRLSSAAAWLRALVRSCWICRRQSGIGAGFLRVLRFPLPIFIPPTAPHASSITRGWYNRPVSGRSTKWTQSHLTSRKKKRDPGVWGYSRATLSLVDINTEIWSSRLGIGRKADDLAL